jgi:transposase, IS5 family
VRVFVEHVFAQEKAHMGLAAMIPRIISPRFIRTIGLKRAEAKITLVNLAYNMKRLIFHERRWNSSDVTP